MTKTKALRQAVGDLDTAIRRLERGEVGGDRLVVLRSLRTQLAGDLDIATRQTLAERDERARAEIEKQARVRAESRVRPVAPIVGGARVKEAGA